jgi:putative SOS response-associated peptidase YedK
MCGRYTITESPNELAARFRAALAGVGFAPRYNAAPTQVLPVVVDEDGRRLALMRWGLIPSWAKDESIGNRLINARADSVASKPSFRTAFKHRRCLVPADGFYEWLKEGKTKTPIRVTPEQGGVIAFAGLWDRWKDAEGRDVLSFTIITTDANDQTRKVHDRMPLMLPRNREDDWLDPKADATTLQRILESPVDTRLTLEPVSTRVNSPRNDDPSLIQREATSLFPLD